MDKIERMWRTPAIRWLERKLSRYTNPDSLLRNFCIIGLYQSKGKLIKFSYVHVPLKDVGLIVEMNGHAVLTDDGRKAYTNIREEGYQL